MLRTQETALRALRDASKRCDSKIEAVIAGAMAFKDSVGASLWGSSDVPGQSYSLAEVLVEAQRTVRSIKSLQWARAGLATATSISNVAGNLQGLEGTVDQLQSAIDAVKTDARTRQIGNGPTAILSGGEQLLDLGGPAANLYNQCESLKGTLPDFLLFPRLDRDVEEKDIGLFAEKLATLSGMHAEAATALAEIRSARDSATALGEEVSDAKEDFDLYSQNLREQLKQAIAEVETAKTSTISIKDEASSLLTEAESSKESLDDVVSDAEERQKTIAAFSTSLDDVKNRLLSIENRAAEAYNKQTDYIEEVETLIKRAEAMVSGATVAGLAKAFADERASLENGMKGAMISFFVGIGFIFLVTLLLAAYVFEIPLQIGSIHLSGAGKTPELGDEITIAGVLSRTVILLAPFWLTLFSARRYRNLFDLRQQYSHKYNMAFSVDGFKQQAPSYQEQIAAWVFHVVAESPVSPRPKGKGMDDNPLPSLSDIVKLPGDRFSELLKAAGEKAAS